MTLQPSNSGLIEYEFNNPATMDINKKYFNIPVPMLRDLHINSKRFFDDAFDVGLYLYSKTLKGSEEKRYKDSLHFFGMTQSNFRNGIVTAKQFLNRIPNKYPTTGIEKDMLFDYYKNDKSDFDIICLSAFLGIKSIIGKKPYDKTNKSLIHARMFGYTTAKELPAELTPLQEKYKLRYQMDKILTELEINWHLKILWNHNRGFYLSFDLSYDELAMLIEKSKQDSKIQQLKESKRKAIENAKHEFTTH
jgi:hypothetical protein